MKQYPMLIFTGINSYGHFTDNCKVKRLEEKVKKKNDAEHLNESCNTDIVVTVAEKIYHLVHSMSWIRKM